MSFKCSGVSYVGFLLVFISLTVTESAVAQNLMRASVPGGELEYEDRGEGEPVLLIHGTGIAGTFMPFMAAPSLDGYRLIRYHRRGYAGSSSTGNVFSIEQDAADALALLDAIGIERAHVVGHSAGGIVSMQLASSAPERVQSLSILDPPLAAFARERPQAPRDTSAPADSVNAFFTRVGGNEWRQHVEATVGGAVRQAEEDVHRIFVVELPALGDWVFDAQKAAQVTAPILFVGQRRNGSVELAASWWPRMEFEELPGTTHLFPFEEPTATAEAVAAFLARQPM